MVPTFYFSIESYQKKTCASFDQAGRERYLLYPCIKTFDMLANHSIENHEDGNEEGQPNEQVDDELQS